MYIAYLQFLLQYFLLAALYHLARLQIKRFVIIAPFVCQKYGFFYFLAQKKLWTSIRISKVLFSLCNFHFIEHSQETLRFLQKTKIYYNQLSFHHDTFLQSVLHSLIPYHDFSHPFSLSKKSHFFLESFHDDCS